MSTQAAMFPKEPQIVLAQVRCVTPLKDDDGWVRRVLTPLIPIGHTHFQATVLYDLLEAGVRWSTLKQRYGLAKKNSKKAVIAYVMQRGRCINSEKRGWGGFMALEVVPILPKKGD